MSTQSIKKQSLSNLIEKLDGLKICKGKSFMNEVRFGIPVSSSPIEIFSLSYLSDILSDPLRCKNIDLEKCNISKLFKIVEKYE